MSPAVEKLMKQTAAAGLQLSADRGADRIMILGPRPSESLLSQIRGLKPELIAALTAIPPVAEPSPAPVVPTQPPAPDPPRQ